jgi:predicted nucleotidyltransferase
MTNILLPADIEAWARAEVSAGRAESVEILVAETLRERRTMSAAHADAVAQAYASLARGDVREEAEVDAELDRWIAEDLAAR